MEGTLFAADSRCAGNELQRNIARSRTIIKILERSHPRNHIITDAVKDLVKTAMRPSITNH